jgi:hypothetical protein
MGRLPASHGAPHRRPDGGRVPPRPGGPLTRPERLRPTPPTCEPDPEPLLEGLAMAAHTGSSPLTASSGRSGPETGSQTTEYALIMVVTMKIDHRGLGRRRLSAKAARGLGAGAERVGAGGDGGPQRPDRMTASSGRDGDEGHCRLVTHRTACHVGEARYWPVMAKQAFLIKSSRNFLTPPPYFF